MGEHDVGRGQHSTREHGTPRVGSLHGEGAAQHGEHKVSGVGSQYREGSAWHGEEQTDSRELILVE